VGSLPNIFHEGEFIDMAGRSDDPGGGVAVGGRLFSPPGVTVVHQGVERSSGGQSPVAQAGTVAAPQGRDLGGPHWRRSIVKLPSVITSANRLAVVSGGGTGIGLATAVALAGDGYDVAVTGRRADVLESAAEQIRAVAPVAALPLVADLREPASARALATALDGRAVDVVVNNAGGYVGRTGDGLEDIAQQWQRSYETNVLTAVLLTEALLPSLRRPGGRVILISSQAAQRGGGGPYSAGKAALHGWMFDLAAQLGPDGCTANVISPGFIDDTEFFGPRMTPEGYSSRVNATLVGRAGAPDDIAQTVRWLAAPSGGYVTGQIINVNGGSVLGR
jgi:3-oxoacyl-[acyl-carrier protein] reductase